MLLPESGMLFAHDPREGELHGVIFPISSDSHCVIKCFPDSVRFRNPVKGDHIRATFLFVLFKRVGGSQVSRTSS